MKLNTWLKEQQDISLLDEEFLAALTEQRERDIYARIVSLDIDELPIQYIEGRVTSGSINIDGDSAVRRTCSLTMVTEQIDIDDFYWGIRTKISLLIGIKNNLSDDYYAPSDGIYPDIVWFPQGIYYLSTFNTSISTNTCTISLQGKDKMCMLNGDLGGQLFASVDFGTEEVMNKVFKKAATFQTSSDLLITKKYFIIPQTEPEGSIADSDSNYSFEFNAEGTYYKEQNFYKKIPNNRLNSYKGKRYKIYQSVVNPNDLFVQSNDTYAPGEFYYRKNDTQNGQGYYIVDNNREATQDRVYYKLNDLYEIDYEQTIEKIPIEKIIRESVHAYAKEPYQNIIINDLDEYGLEQLTYKGEETLYALRNVQTQHFTQLMLEGTNQNFDSIVKGKNPITNEDFVFDQLVPALIVDNGLSYIKIRGRQFEWADASDEDAYTVAQITYGQDIGYRLTDLVYAGDLVSGIGDTLTSVLDKIKEMLGDFEYFYDLEGHFVFQRKKNYVNTKWEFLQRTEDETYVTFANDKRKFSFNFEGNRLITAIQNSPVLTNLRNDYSVWGVRKSVNGADLPIHARYAIDKKPREYYAFNGILYYTTEATSDPSDQLTNMSASKKMLVDWRELIYQMALDYFAGQGCSEEEPIYDNDLQLVLSTPDHFLPTIAERNPAYFPSGYTGYEQYYTDMQGFWRQLYNPDYSPVAVYEAGYYEVQNEPIANSNFYRKVKTWVDNVVSDYKINYYVKASQYASSMQTTQKYRLTKDTQPLSGKQYYERTKNNDGSYNYSLVAQPNSNQMSRYYEHEDYHQYLVADDDNKLYWSTTVFEAAETLNFWIEFLDSKDELAEFTIAQVGDRTKTVNEQKASAIIFKEIPDIILCPQKTVDGWCDTSKLRKALEEETGYTFVYFPPGFAKYFTLSYRSLCVKDKIDELLYKHSYCSENITITALPIYHLQPNTRIYVHDATTHIDGEYLVSKFSIPLTYNGTMSITAVKAPERLY